MVLFLILLRMRDLGLKRRKSIKCLRSFIGVKARGTVCPAQGWACRRQGYCGGAWRDHRSSHRSWRLVGPCLQATN
jgi:hypothetical protein